MGSLEIGDGWAMRSGYWLVCRFSSDGRTCRLGYAAQDQPYQMASGCIIKFISQQAACNLDIGLLLPTLLPAPRQSLSDSSHPPPGKNKLPIISHKNSRQPARITCLNPQNLPFLAQQAPTPTSLTFLLDHPPPPPFSTETAGRQYFPSLKSQVLLDELYQLNSRMTDSGSSMSLQNLEQVQREQSSEKRNSNYVPGQRSGKWTDLEHMKYIVFIDFNKQRMRSKEKRRSNKFYQEMADFIVTRNALQCRSHHQKLEEKYNHAPKIVNVFKPSFDRTAYRQALDELHSIKRDSSSEKSVKEVSMNTGARHVETQTDIGGLHLQMVMVNNQYMMIHPRGFQCLPHMHPAYFYHPFYQPQQYQHELGSPSLPTSELLHPRGWENRALSFDFQN